MRAVGYVDPGPLHRPEALLDLNLPRPTPGPADLLVRVHAVGVNPVDTKVRRSRQGFPDEPVVLGWDAVGVVESCGADVKGFSMGDRVFYAGALDRPGCNAEFHAVDYRLAAHAPKRLTDAEAASIPLTALTAWELLFDRLRLPRGGGAGDSLLIVGGGGGVGSILIQLARSLTQLNVIATASRRETIEWCISKGAHQILNHSQPFAPQLMQLKHPQVRYAISLTHTDQHWNELIDVLQPEGALAFIDDPVEPLDVLALKRKSLSLHLELMFTRSLFQTETMSRQGEILAEVARLLDEGVLKPTLSQTFSPINADNLHSAHELLESHRTRGKLVVVGF